MGLDTHLDFKKLKFACEHLLRGSKLIAMHLSPIYKDIDGIRAPGVELNYRPDITITSLEDLIK